MRIICAGHVWGHYLQVDKPGIMLYASAQLGSMRAPLTGYPIKEEVMCNGLLQCESCPSVTSG